METDKFEIARRDEIARRLRSALAELGRGSSARLAEACGVTPQSVRHWKKYGTIDPRHYSVISDFTGKKTRYLFLIDERSKPLTPQESLVQEPARIGVIGSRGEPIQLHNLPILTAENIMTGAVLDDDGSSLIEPPSDSSYSGPAGEGSFIFQAEDDSLSSGQIPVLRGYYVVIDPTLKRRPGRVALVRIAGGRPVLRRIAFDGISYLLEADTDRIKPHAVTADDMILGYMRTAYPKPEED